MKSSYLVGVFSAGLLLAAPLFAQLNFEPFADAEKYSIIVKNNATFAGTHVALGGLIGGNLTMKPGANMEFGNRLTNDFALHVGGNVQSLGGGQVALFGNNYFFAHGNGGVTLQNPGTALASSPLTASVGSIFTALAARSDDFTNASSLGAVSATSLLSGNKLTVNVQAGVTNVFNVTTGMASLLSDQNAEVVINGMIEGSTRLILNYAGGGGSSTLAFKAKTLGLGATTYDQVLWNFTDLDTITFTGDTFHGSIFAPEVGVIWDANDLDGQLVADRYESRSQREIHGSEFWDEQPPSMSPVPEPSTYALFGSALLIAVVGVRRWRNTRLAISAESVAGR